jgi:FkbM family methyltransferase
MIFPAFKYWLESKKWYLNLRYNPTVINAWLALRPKVKADIETQRKKYLAFIKAFQSTGTLDTSKQAHGSAHSQRADLPSVPFQQLIFDIGANEGFLTQIFLEAGYKVVSVEPDPRNFGILQTRFGSNPNVILVNAAVSSSDTPVNFYIDKQDKALGTVSAKWKDVRQSIMTITTMLAVTLDQLIAEHGEPVFIKIDVEGYEEAVLKGLSKRVSLLSFEAILPLFLAETVNAINQVANVMPRAKFNFSQGDKAIQDVAFTKDELKKAIQDVDGTIEIFVVG